jgi:hypothetical protein
VYEQEVRELCMEDKKFIFSFFIAAVFLFSGLTLYAQVSSSAPKPGYYIDNSEETPSFIQRLVWEREEYALNYEVIIQRFSGQYNDYYSKITDDDFIEISLPPGRYQYCVTPFDLFGQRGETSDWERFEVITAYQPEITKISPEYFYMDQFQDRVLEISGNNIFKDSIIYLRNGIRNLFPDNMNVTNNSSIRLTFYDEELIPGVYQIYIINPGGLDAVYHGFVVDYFKRFDILFKIDFNPAFPAYGELQDMFGLHFYPGVTLRAELLSSSRDYYKIGLEFAVSYYYLDNLNYLGIDLFPKTQPDDPFFNYTEPDITTRLIDFAINISMQRRFNRLRNAITFSFGFGTTSFNTISNDLDYSFSRGQTVHVNLNVTALFLIYRRFYFEAGVDFTHYFYNDSGLLRPRLGLIIKI